MRHTFRLASTALLAGLLLPALPAGVAAQAVQTPVAVPAPHDRLLPLQGGRNFRDLGGYRTTDGRQVKWGLLFRSGSMHGLTPADYTYLESRGIRVVCDLRDDNERTSEPVNWPQDHAPQVLSDDYHLDMSGFMPKGPPANWTPAEARSAMAASYPRLLVQFNGQYRRMFAELLAGHAPLAFNCSAGKDRTGIAAALLLTALGVPRETVIDDYTLTNKYLDAKAMVGHGAAPANMTPTGHNPADALRGMPPSLVKAMMVADPSYIAAVFAVLDAHKDGVDGYLRDELGLDHAERNRLRALYLS